MVASLSGQSGLFVRRPAVQGKCACVCVYAPILLQLTEEKTALVGDLKLNIVNPRNALIGLVNTFSRVNSKMPVLLTILGII